MRTLIFISVLALSVVEAVEAQVPPDISYNQETRPKQEQQAQVQPMGTSPSVSESTAPALSEDAKAKALEKHYRPAALRKQLGQAVKDYVASKSTGGAFVLTNTAGKEFALRLLRVEKHSIEQTGDGYVVFGDFKGVDNPGLRALVAFTATSEARITGAELRSIQDITKK